MRDASLQTIHLKQYTPPAFLISDIALVVDSVAACASAGGGWRAGAARTTTVACMPSWIVQT